MADFRGTIGHIEGIESPWGNAGGVVKSIEEVEMMSKTGVGWVEDGSETLLGRLGNGWNAETEQRDKKDWDYNPETGEMHNSLGMPGKGMDAEEKIIPEKKKIANAYGKPLLVNVAPVTAKPAEESLDLIKRAYAAGADGVILNAGCPNVYDEEGNPHEVLSKSPVDFGRVLFYLADAGLSKPIWVRISPQESLANMMLISNPVKLSGIVSAILTPNTWMVPMPVKPNGENLLEVNVPRVGKSGPAMAEEATKETAWAVSALRGSGIDVISSSSIKNANELKRRLSVGAVAGAGTTFFYTSENGWQYDTDRLLSDLAA
jgi:dihydroorotate dehydrogenase